MERSKALTIGLWVLVVLGLVMVYLGGFYGPKVILPPIITAVGFFVIAWVLGSLRK